jgi:hypothetical protein
MQLYNVEVTYNVVILAENKRDAERQAPYIARHEDDSDPVAVVSEQIESAADLKDLWDADCIPYGDNPGGRTIEEILAG